MDLFETLKAARWEYVDGGNGSPVTGNVLRRDGAISAYFIDPVGKLYFVCAFPITGRDFPFTGLPDQDSATGSQGHGATIKD